MRTGKTAHPSTMYLRLADGHDDVFESASRLRRAITLAAAVALLAASMVFAFGSPGSDLLPWKVDDAAAQVPEEDDSGPGDGDDDDDDDDGQVKPDDDDDQVKTDGDDDANTDDGTRRETKGNTDAGGQDTGKSTRGETDGGDNTGRSEATEGTRAETKGKTDAGNKHTGASTRGETDPGDDTGKTERV
jgi:hypothetical protein